jgi:2',3'-cyclic-nucleotide 2'-phosphodiesterase (5'-nucleotidase family)
VVANVEDSNPDGAVQFPPYVVQKVDGLRIGIFGLTTPTTPIQTSAINVAGVTFRDDLVNISQKVVNKLRNEEKCDIVILLSHLGEAALDYTAGSEYLAAHFDGIDVIIDGHSHTALPVGSRQLNNDYETLVAQAYWGLRNVGTIDLVIDCESKKIVGKRASLLNFEDFADTAADEETSAFLQRGEDEFAVITKQVIGTSDFKLPMDGRHRGNSTAAFLVAASVKWATPGSDFGMINAGSVRTDIPEGNISYGDCISVIPFFNTLVSVEMTGAQLRQFLEFGTQRYESGTHQAFPTVAGLKYTIDVTKAWNETGRISEMSLIDVDGNDKGPVEETAVYHFATSDFIANGGDGYAMLVDLRPLLTFGDAASALMDYIKDIGHIDGSQAFFKTAVISQVGDLPAQKLAVKSLRRVGNDDGSETIFVSKDFSAMNYQFRNGSGVWKPFFEYSVRASRYLVNDLEFLRSIAPAAMSYLSADGIVISGASDFRYGSSLGDGGIAMSEGDFQELRNGKTDKGWMAAGIVLVVLVVALGAALGFVVWRWRSRSRRDTAEAGTYDAVNDA